MQHHYLLIMHHNLNIFTPNILFNIFYSISSILTLHMFGKYAGDDVGRYYAGDDVVQLDNVVLILVIITY